MIRGQLRSALMLRLATDDVAKPVDRIGRQTFTKPSDVEGIAAAFDLEAELMKREDAEFDARCDLLSKNCRDA